MKTWSDVAVLRRPSCGRNYVDASWYVVEMKSDIECGGCDVKFNSKAQQIVMLEFQIIEDGKCRWKSSNIRN